MKKDYIKIQSNTFRKFFFSYLFIFFIIIIILSIIALTAIKKERKKQQENFCYLHAEKITVSVNNQLNSIHSITASLRNATWISKLMSDTNVFDNEFDFIRQDEISTELRNYAAANKIIKDVSVIYPKKNIVVTSKGWWKLDEYSKYINTNYNIKSDFINDTVLSEKNNYGALSQQNFCYHDDNQMIIAQQMEFTENPRAVALIYINKKYLHEILSQFINEQVNSITIKDNENQILIQENNKNPESKNYSITFPCNSLLLNIQTDYMLNSTLLKHSDIIIFLLILFATIIVLIIISYILASINYSPLNKLLKKLYESKNDKLNKKQSEYGFIADSIQNLYDENNNMQKNLALYKETARKGLYLQLLRGYFSNDSLIETLLQYDIPYTNEFFYAVIVISTSQISVNETPDVILDEDDENLKAKLLVAVEYTAKKAEYQSKVIDTMDDNIAIILCFHEEIEDTTLYQCAAAINNSIYNLSNLSADSSVGKVHKGIIGISISYQEAKNSNKIALSKFDKTGISMFQNSESMYYYPTDWEQQLINNLKVGNNAVVTSIMKEIEKENNNLSLSNDVIERLIELIFETIQRVSYELNIDRNEMIEKYTDCSSIEQKWESLYHAAFYICEKIAVKNVEMIEDINHDILKYINQNYCNQDISLKTISSKFNISVASVSRIFKEVTNINFHDYITSLRMEKAKELLKTCGYDLKNISKVVGYDSEYSFKRAFFRVEGIKPKDYANKVSANM